MPVPPQAVRSAAARGLKLRSEYGRGGTSVGIGRARDLSNGRDISISTINRMVSFFARHGAQHKDGWKTQDNGEPSNGWIAWLLWGGDAGKSWASSQQSKAKRESSSFSVTEFLREQGFVTPSVESKLSPGLPDQRERAFLSQVDDRVVLTAPFRTIASVKSERLLNLRGRLVGAEEPNRNNAFWTAGDLELGMPSVSLGPLNWLHDERKVVGVISDSRLVPGREGRGSGHRELSADGGTHLPHIEADSQVWRWMNRGEVAAIELAADAGKLWYSMECVSERVRCMEQDCDRVVSYMEFIQKADAVCDHMGDRSGVRRMEDPTFLGAAVVLPPVRPGWADANLDIMREAASSLSESFLAAGSPEAVKDSWPEMMAQVVAFARA